MDGTKRVQADLKKESHCPYQDCPSNIGVSQRNSSFEVKITETETLIDILSNLAIFPSTVKGENLILLDEIEIYENKVKVYDPTQNIP